MTVGRFATKLGYSVIGALAFVSLASSPALAQGDHSHIQPPQNQQMTPDQKSKASALVEMVRDATRRFQDVTVAEAEGYHLQFGCVTGPDRGAMGMHFVNGDLVKGGVIDARHPQIVIYEPLPNGRLQLVGADYLVDQETWDNSSAAPPELMGQLFHLFEFPNRFELKAFYSLHVWAWKDNPNGTFVNWHPNVACDAFGGEKR